jgi:hypothetical protein
VCDHQCAGSKDADQQALYKQKYAEAQDELESIRALIEDQAGHLECYRNKVSVQTGPD